MPQSKVMVAITAIIENEKGEILLINHSSENSPPYCWEHVCGRLFSSEIPVEGLLRIIKEETGIIAVEIIKPLTVFQVVPEDEREGENELISISYWCRTKTTSITVSPKYSDYLWVAPEKAIELTGHSALRSYIQIFLREKSKAEKIDLLSLQ